MMFQSQDISELSVEQEEEVTRILDTITDDKHGIQWYLGTVDFIESLH